MKHLHSVIFAIAFSITGAAPAAWNRLPVADEVIVDLASRSIAGTEIHSSNGVESAQVLLSSDYTKSASVPAGASDFVVKFPNQQVIDTVYMVNDGLSGTITCTGSTDGKDWVSLAQAKVPNPNFSADRCTVPMHFASAQVKYLKISFDTSRAGGIRSLGICGAGTSKDFLLEPVTDDSADSGDRINYIFSGAGGRPVYAFPTPVNVGELNYLQNIFRFADTDSKFCTIVFDLASVRNVKEFTASCSKKPVRLEVFVFDKLPEKKDWRGKLTLDPAVFDSMKPIASGEDALGVGYIKVHSQKNFSTQFVALRFEVNYNQKATAYNFSRGLKNATMLLLGPGGEVLKHFGLFENSVDVAGKDNSITVQPTINSPGKYHQNQQSGNNDRGDNENAKQKNQKGDHEEGNNNGGGFYGGGFYGGGAGGGGGGGGGNNNGNNGNNGNNNGNNGNGGGVTGQSNK